MTDPTPPSATAASPRLYGHLVPADPSRLLRTLCNHWRHRFQIERDGENTAFIPFGESRSARFVSADSGLRIEAAAADPSALTGLREVIEEHLRRFERNPELVFVWRETAA